VEFRHDSWFVDEVYNLLRERDVALVAVDEDEAEGKGSPLVVTASWGYLRLRRSAYDRTALEIWAERIRANPWTEAYVFLKHEDGSPTGPAAAGEMGEILTKTSER
jgi:uncharacterized protein YecE (DUF72 family)